MFVLCAHVFVRVRVCVCVCCILYYHNNKSNFSIDKLWGLFSCIIPSLLNSEERRKTDVGDRREGGDRRQWSALNGNKRGLFAGVLRALRVDSSEEDRALPRKQLDVED